MKTDDEMIESLFRRREEYYKKSAGRKILFALHSGCGRITVPLAAAAAAALFMITVHKNAVTDDIGRDITDTPKTSAAEAYGAHNDISSLATDEKQNEETKKLPFENAPFCFSFDGMIYKYYDENSYPEIYRFDKNKLREAGTGVILETDPEVGICTVYNVEGSDCKAVAADNGVYLYKAVGESSYTVEGIEFKIKAVHRTAKKYHASMLPVFKEGEDIIFRAYDEKGYPVNDTFILYAPSLTEVMDSVLWEVSSEFFYQPTYSAPIVIFDYYDMTELCRRIRNDSLTAGDIIGEFGISAEIAVNNEIIAAGSQIYYTDFYRTEYVLEAYENSDEIALTRIASGETIYLTDPDCDFERFLAYENVPLEVRDQYSDGSELILRLTEMWAYYVLTVKEVTQAGGQYSEDRYEIFYNSDGKEYAAEAYADLNGKIESFSIRVIN